MRKAYLIAILIAFAGNGLWSQVLPTSAYDRAFGLTKRKQLDDASLVNHVTFRNIGPTIMSGRVTDIEVNPSDPTKFYVSYASGGLWYTENNGQSFKPVFDKEDVITIGDFAVDWENKIIWVGTGEVNSSRSSYAGNGVYKSYDNGTTWIYCGLPESQHIGKIQISPNDKNIVFVAAMGHLYSPNKDRGVYKTIDGGLTWKQTLYVDSITGAVDLLIDPNVKSFLYATTWTRERSAWNFSEGGSGSGIYKSIDDGESWVLLTDSASGFPHGKGVGRIGIAVSAQHNNIVYAVVDNQFPKDDITETKKDTSVITVEDLRNIPKDYFLSLNNNKLDKFLTDNNFPKEYTAAKIKQKVASDEFKPSVLTDYLNDGGYVFNLPIKGCEVYRSNDGGTTWYKTHQGYLDGAFFTYGYYFSTIKVSPQNENKLLLSAFNTLLSEDAGKTFKNIDGPNVHPDHHAAWFDPKNDKHIIIGNDGGVNITYDNGANWFLANNPAVGQFYSVTVDNATPYNVYGGLQDNGVWSGPSNYTQNNYWQASGQYPYKAVYGGDGMQVQVDTRDNNTVYTGYQYGYYARVNKSTGEEELSIRPRHNLGEMPLRFNWQTPIWVSKFNQDILYYGSNKFHRSLNKGADLQTLSGDLTYGKKEGDVPYGTVTTIHESPLKFGLLYCGTDDGNIWMSKDGGYTWSLINVVINQASAPANPKSKTPPQVVNKIPSGLWVSRVTASKYEEGTVYASLNGYRYDNFNPYLFISKNYGASWSQIGTDLPAEPINVIKEDPKNKNIIYVGTDNGLYVSLNRGASFMSFNGGLPRVAVHDIAIQEREDDIVIGTHGRSIYVADLEEIQSLDTIMNQDVFVYNLPVEAFDENWGHKDASFYEAYVPSVSFPVFLKKDSLNNPRKVTITIGDTKGTVLRTFTDTLEGGLNYINYDLSIDDINASPYKYDLRTDGGKYDLKQADDKKYYLVPGKYPVKFDVSGLNAVWKNFEVEEQK